MKHPLLPQKCRMSACALCLAVFSLFLFGMPQTSFAFYAAIMARGNIGLLSDGSFVDSFNSSDPLQSANGQYDSDLAGDNGSIISLTGSVSIGNSDIYGPALTVPEAAVYCGTNGGIGTHSWLSTNSGIEPGYVIPDGENFKFPTVTLPYVNGADLPPGGSIVSFTGTTNVFSATNSSTPPPQPDPFQTIVSSIANIYIAATNTVIQVTGTNSVVTLTRSNLECGTVVYSGTTLPPNWCTYVLVGTGNPKMGTNYQWTLIAGTNLTYATNEFVTYSTNSVPVFGTNYNYTVYTAILQTNYYDHLLNGGNYCAGNLAGATLVASSSTLVLTNGLNMTGADTLIIASNASLTVYVDGGTVTISGNQLVNNSLIDTNLQIYCTPGVPSLELNDLVQLLAVIVAPDTDLYVNASNSSPFDFSGALMVNSLTINSVIHLHGDESASLPIAPLIAASADPPPFPPTYSNPVALVGWRVDFSAGPNTQDMALQWYFDGTNLIAGATNSLLVISNVTVDMAGEYTVQASLPGLFMVSEPAQLTVVTTPAATLNSVSVSADDHFQFTANGLPGYPYRVEGSTNLSDWTPLSIGLSPFTFTDTKQIGLQYFYRAVYVPQ